MKRLIGLAGAVLGMSVAGLPGTYSAADATSGATCHGVKATIVGEPKATVRGTAHRDVILTHGARYVYAGKGNDLICVTGPKNQVDVYGGAGDDEVYVMDDRSPASFTTGPGSDTFIGNGRRNVVNLETDGHDKIRTKSGDDELFVTIDIYSGRPDINTGADEDTINLKSSYKHTSSPDTVEADLAARQITVADTRSGDSHTIEARNLEDISVTNFANADLRGNDSDNVLEVQNACTASLSGRGGDDRLHAGVTDTPHECTPPATSTADGGAGTDQCFAVVEVACEEALSY
jgi:hypothetical protein